MAKAAPEVKPVDFNEVSASFNKKIRAKNNEVVAASKGPNRIIENQHRADLKLLVAEYMKVITQALHDKVVVSDGTGLLQGQSSFGDIVNGIAKEVLQEHRDAYAAEQAAAGADGKSMSDMDKAILVDSNKAGVFRTVWIQLANGCRYLVDKVTGLVTWTYRGIKRVLCKIWDTLCGWYTAAKNWIMSFFAKKQPTVAQGVTIEGQSSVIDVEPVVVTNSGCVPAGA